MCVRFLCAFVAAYYLLIVAASAADRPPSEHTIGPTRDTLVIGMTQRPQAVTPLRSAALANTFLWGFINRSITGYDETWSPTCFLCTEIPTHENGRIAIVTLPDGRSGMEVTFTIRPDTRWADGVPVTSRDVAFTVDVAHLIGVSSYANTFYAHLLKVKALNDTTFTLTFDEINYSFAVQTDIELLSEHIDGPIFRASKSSSDYLEHSAYTRDLENAGLWDGPYRIESVSDEFVLAVNSFWPGEKPQFRKIILRRVPHDTDVKAWLLSDAIDYLPSEGGTLSASAAIDIAGQLSDRFDLLSRPTLQYEHISLNHDKPLFADRRVRQALLLALDRTEMAERLFHDPTAVADSFVSANDSGYDPNVRRYPYDPARARTLLVDAGFHPGPDGVLVGPDNQRLALDLVTTTGNAERTQLCQWIKTAWTLIGVDTHPIQVSPEYFLKNVGPLGNFDAAIFATILPPEFPPTAFLGSSAIPTQTNQYSGLNWDRYSNHRLDDVMKDLSSELDRSHRLRFWRVIQDIYTEELPALPLFMHDSAFLIPKWLTGIRPTGHRTPTSYWVEHWRAQ